MFLNFYFTSKRKLSPITDIILQLTTIRAEFKGLWSSWCTCCLFQYTLFCRSILVTSFLCSTAAASSMIKSGQVWVSLLVVLTASAIHLLSPSMSERTIHLHNVSVGSLYHKFYRRCLLISTPSSLINSLLSTYINLNCFSSLGDPCSLFLLFFPFDNLQSII